METFLALYFYSLFRVAEWTLKQALVSAVHYQAFDQEIKNLLTDIMQDDTLEETCIYIITVMIPQDYYRYYMCQQWHPHVN